MQEICNLDASLNKLGYTIYTEIKNESNKSTRKNLINHVDKALGVLTNDGVYAYYVFCLSKDKDKEKEKGKGNIDYITESKYDNSKKYTKIFIEIPVSIIKTFLTSNCQNSINEEFFQQLSKNLHDLLFFRDLLERALIYARYHLKTLDVSGDEHE